MKKIIVGAAISLVLVASQAYADKMDYPAYIGAGGSYTHYDTGLSTTGDLDETGWGWKLFGGYRFHENFALEAFYFQSGDTTLDWTATDTVEGVLVGTAGDATIDVQSFGASAVLLLPVSDEVDLYGKLGVHRWDGDASINIAGVNVDVDGDGTDALFGVGASFAPTENVSLRLEYERYFIDSEHMDAGTLGLELHF